MTSNSNNQWSLLKKNPQGQDTLDKMIDIVVNKDNNPLIFNGYTSTQTKQHIKIKHHEQNISKEQVSRLINLISLHMMDDATY